jgi:hypothetical protein
MHYNAYGKLWHDNEAMTVVSLPDKEQLQHEKYM